MCDYTRNDLIKIFNLDICPNKGKNMNVMVNTPVEGSVAEAPVLIFNEATGEFETPRVTEEVGTVTTEGDTATDVTIH